MNHKPRIEAAYMFVDEQRPCPWGDEAGRMFGTDGASMIISTPNTVPPHSGVASHVRYAGLQWMPTREQP
jgi:hypothetical protein